VLVVNAVLGNLVVSAAPAVPAAAGVVVPGALESALVVPVLARGSGLGVVVVVGGRELPSVAECASVLARLVGVVDVGTVDVGAGDVGSVDVGAIDVAPATDETGTIEFSMTALDDAPGC
jgi:hypothetical protein